MVALARAAQPLPASPVLGRTGSCRLSSKLSFWFPAEAKEFTAVHYQLLSMNMAPTTNSRTIRIRGLDPRMTVAQFGDLAKSLEENSSGRRGLFSGATPTSDSSQSQVGFCQWFSEAEAKRNVPAAPMVAM